MKTWIVYLFFLTFAYGVFADEAYHGIYQVKPQFIGYSKEYAEIKPFCKDALAQVKELDKAFPREQPRTDREIFGIDTFSLKKNATKAIFVWIEDRAVCGANVCPLQIYQRNNSGKLEKISEELVHDGPIVLESTSYDYHDLAYYWWEYGKQFYIIYRWDGAHYKLSERVPVSQVILE